MPELTTLSAMGLRDSSRSQCPAHIRLSVPERKRVREAQLGGSAGPAALGGESK